MPPCRGPTVGVALCDRLNAALELIERVRDDPVHVEYAWSTVCVNIKYLGFAAHHIGATKVADMTECARRALVELERLSR